MYLNRRLIVGLLAGFFVMIGIAGAVANNALRAEPTAVAVVNIERAFDALDEKASVEAEIRARGEELAEEEQQRRRHIRRLQEDLEVLGEGGQAFREKQDELQRAVIDLQAWTQFQQRRIAQEHMLQTERLYRKMMAEIARISEDEGYDLVLFRESEPQFQAENPQELVAQIQIRKVLYASDAVDITQQVAQRLNNAFTAGP